MVEAMSTVLIVGASGSIGRLVVAEALEAGYETRALVRNETQADTFPAGTRVVVGDLTDAETLRPAVAGVTVIVFTHGSHGSPRDAELVDYGAVRNVLSVLEAPARIALMTAIGVPSTRLVTTGSVEENASSGPAACRTRSSAPVGSTTTLPISTGSSCCRATSAGQVIPPMGSSRALRSLRFSSPH